MTLSEIIKSIFVKTILDVLEEREERIKGDVDRTEYKHIVHAVIKNSTQDVEDTDLYFIVRNYDSALITSFSGLISNFKTCESVMVYNQQLETTNIFVVKETDNLVSVNDGSVSFTDTNGSDIIIIKDECTKMC